MKPTFAPPVLIALLLMFAAPTLPCDAADKAPPKFQEVLDLIRSHLGSMSPAELDQAALKSLLQQLDGRVTLGDKPDAPAAPKTGPSISKAMRFEDAFGYLRISHVGADLPAAITTEFAKLGKPAKLKGLMLDLRFADGTNQVAAAQAAAQFLATDKLLLTVGGEAIHSSVRTNAIQLPVTILVNRQTSGAAEVLAALLRQHQVGLLLGTATTGGLRQFKEFTLSTGQRLRIATNETKLGDGQAMPATGLRPDIALNVTPEEERAFYSEPYKPLPAAAKTTSAKGTNATPARINEAELIRRQQAGEDPDAAPVQTVPLPAIPPLRDPAIARALDLLKGLAVVRAAKP
jgi:hypothetical protein